MKRGYKYRLYPTIYQKELFSKYFGACRFVYNTALDLKKYVYATTGESLSGYDLSKQLTQAKKEEGFEWLSEVPSDTLIQEMMNLEKAYKNFFRRVKKGLTGKEVGFPRFKSRNDNQSFYLRVARKNKGIIKFDMLLNQRSRKVWINKKIGWVKYVDDRVNTKKQPNGVLCASATISKTPSEKYFISLLYDDQIEPVDKIETSKESALSIHFGVNFQVTTYDGRKVKSTENTENFGQAIGINFFRKEQKNLKAKQVKLKNKKGSKKGEKKSSNFLKQKKKVAIVHERIAAKRKYYIENIVCSMLSNNPSVVFIENWKIKKMTKSAKGTLENPGINVRMKSNLNKAILEQGWGYMKEFIRRKCSERGINIIEFKFLKSSVTCSKCLYIHKEVQDKNLKKWTCPHCKERHDREYNAVINIYNEGIKSL